VLAVWAMCVALLTGLGLGVEDRLAPSTLSVPGSESARGAEIIERQFGGTTPVAVLLDGPPTELERQGAALVRALERRAPGVRAISPWSGAEVIDDLRPDPGTALIFAELPVRDDEEGDEILARVEGAVEEAISPPVEASLSGPVVIGEAIKQASLDATRRAELIALPVLFLVLLFVFRSPVAAAVPLLFGGATVVATRGLVALFAGAMEIDATAVSAASMVGLALGVDYALLLVSRYREGLHGGLGVAEAVATARATAGRTVVFAGFVLGGAMLSPLVLAPGALLTSMAFVVMLVVVVSVVNAVVAGPALLVLVGERTERWRIGSGREPRLGGTLARALRRPGAAGGNPLREGARLFTPPDGDAARQAQVWEAQGRTADAALMRALARVPQAIRLTGGGPEQVRHTVRDTMAQAARQDAVPVFVTDFVPMRDCHNGGAASPEAYRAWIDAVAEGIGDGRAVVALEPAGLSRAPGTPECPAGGPQALRQRYADLGYAVTRLGGLPRTAVYLDGGLAGWPALEASAERLAAAGVAGADGFYLNVNGHRPTRDSVAWGVRLAKCVHLRLSTGATACPEDALRDVPDDTAGLPRFVVDTSRNGTGEWRPPPGRFADPQEWCNPPGRGAGARPTTTDTGHALVDALLWLNDPGRSTMRCTRGTAGPEDPVYGVVTPDAGQWWPELALERARNAVPPLPE